MSLHSTTSHSFPFISPPLLQDIPTRLQDNKEDIQLKVVRTGLLLVSNWGFNMRGDETFNLCIFLFQQGFSLANLLHF